MMQHPGESVGSSPTGPKEMSVLVPSCPEGQDSFSTPGQLAGSPLGSVDASAGAGSPARSGWAGGGLVKGALQRTVTGHDRYAHSADAE